MAKGEIGWKRVDEFGVKLQVYSKRVRGKWTFFVRERRFDNWEPLNDPTIEDWGELINAAQRRIGRGMMPPKEHGKLIEQLREEMPSVTEEELAPWDVSFTWRRDI